MRTLELPAGASPRAWGRLHGESYRCEIGALTEIRTFLCGQIAGMTRAQAVDLARAHLPVLERWDHALYEELVGIAEGAAREPADLVILNHYTDLRDIGPTQQDGRAEADGCSALFARTPAGHVLAQTWDMHASAMPYMMLLRVPADPGPGALVLTLTGCLGLAGMSARRVGVVINNLNSTDARVGLVWPALVRRILREPDAARARDVALSAPLGSGHHYLIADRAATFAIETSGTQRKVVFSGERARYLHTNHCLDGEVAACSRVPGGSTTYERYALLERSLAERPLVDVDDAWQRLGSHEGYPRSVCANLSTPEKPHLMATCAGIAMDLAQGAVLAVAGFTHNVQPERHRVPGDPP